MRILHFLPNLRELTVAFCIAFSLYLLKLRIEPYATAVFGDYKKSWQENARSRLARIALYRIERRLRRGQSLYLLCHDQAHLIRTVATVLLAALATLLAWSFQSNLNEISPIVNAHRWVAPNMVAVHLSLDLLVVFVFCITLSTIKSLNDSYPGNIRKHSQKTRAMLIAYVERYGRPDSHIRIASELGILAQE
jgi:hypothetical protein